MAFLQLSSIDKSYAGTAALSHINLSIHAGEILALVGENGAGKSTLIEIIAGMTAPDSGELYIDGKQVDISEPERPGCRYQRSASAQPFTTRSQPS